MVLLKYQIDHPLLQETLTSVPQVEAEYHYSCNPLDGAPVTMVTIECSDVDALEAALDGDQSVANPQILQESNDRRLYKFEPMVPEEASRIRRKIAELGGVLQTATGTDDGWVVTIEFPDRPAVNAFYEFCIDGGFALDILEVQADEGLEATALTDRQRDVIATALDAGYFEVPRECSLSELAQALDISPNAASERLRRGVRNLADSALPPAGEREERPTIGAMR